MQIVSEGLIGGKVVEIQPGKPGSSIDADEPAAEGAMLASLPTTELADVLGDVSQTLQALRTGQGTIAKLTNEPAAHDAAVEMLHQGKEALASIQQVADGMGKLPLVGGYIEDPVAILERPNSQRDRRDVRRVGAVRGQARPS